MIKHGSHHNTLWDQLVLKSAGVLQGATVVDFAYHVHTDVGNQMVAAKVNGKVVSPSYVLSNAEVVQIIRYKKRPNNGDISRHKVRALSCHHQISLGCGGLKP